MRSMSARRVIEVSLACLLSAGTAHSANPSPGYYLAEGGWGDLKIKPSNGKALPFKLLALGPNAHTCDLEGVIEGNRAILEGEGGKACTVVFSASPGLVGVAPVDNEPCRGYCGVRAWFAKTYILPAAKCTPAAKASAQKRFTALYRAKSYTQALAELAPMLTECSKTLHWIEEGHIRNDVAVTQYHLGRIDECKSTLAPVLRDATGDEDSLREALPPTDFDSFLPIAKAAWFNAKLCSSGAK
jgi:hypothetical protein